MKDINRDSLGEAIYQRLCEDLVSGKLRPNEKVTIRSLSEALGTSSTPVRDAMQRLLRDNALEQRSLRDVRVPVLTSGEYMEILRIRVHLEGLAAASAAEIAQDKDIAHLRRIVERNEKAIQAQRWVLASALNQQFHFALAEIAQMPILLGVLNRLWLRMGPLISGYYATATEDMVQHHHEIIRACVTRAPDKARAEMQADIESSKEGIIEFIKTLDAQ